MRIISKHLPKYYKLLQHSPILKQILSFSSAAKYNILFFGNDEFSLPYVVRLFNDSKQPKSFIKSFKVVTLFNNHGHSRPVQQFSTKHDIPLSYWTEMKKSLSDEPHSFDLAVVASFGVKFTDEFIKSFPLGMINVHPSFLPDLRGAAPIPRAIERGDQSTGVSIFKIIPGKMDSGPVLAKSKPVDIKLHDVAATLCERLAVTGAQLCLDVLSDFPHKLKHAHEQDEKCVTKASKISPKDTCIQWDEMKADDIYNKYKAFGFLKKFSLCAFYGSMFVKFYRIQVVFPEKFGIQPDNYIPGQVFYKSKANLMIVACKEGFVGIYDLMVPMSRLKRPPLNITKLHKEVMHPVLEKDGIVLFKNSYYCEKTSKVTETKPSFSGKALFN